MILPLAVFLTMSTMEEVRIFVTMPNWRAASLWLEALTA